MSKLLNSQGKPIKNEIATARLPTVDQILKDPITKKFVFLESVDHPDQTCIGLTEETDYHGVVYKYGEVTLPDEKTLEANDHLRLKFKYDILDNNGISRDKFGDEFFKLIGDILYHIIITQSEQNSEYPNDRNNNTQ